jgi:hypothetical protein
MVSLVAAANRSLEHPELRLMIAQYGGPTAFAENYA